MHFKHKKYNSLTKGRVSTAPISKLLEYSNGQAMYAQLTTHITTVSVDVQLVLNLRSL